SKPSRAGHAGFRSIHGRSASNADATRREEGRPGAGAGEGCRNSRSMTGSCRSARELEALHPVVEGADGNSEFLRGVGAVAVEAPEGGLDVAALDLLERRRAVRLPRRQERAELGAEGGRLEIDLGVVAEHEAAFQEVLELADVARPGVALQDGEGTSA